MNSGIYTIENLVNGKLYVGWTINFKQRKSKHWSTLKRGVHKNPHLSAAVKKYGIDNFKFEILEECEEQFLVGQEHYWCVLLDTHNRKRGYNELPTHPYGKARISEESKKRRSISATGRKHTPETLIILRERKLGHTQTTETIEKRTKRGHTQKKSTVHKRVIATLKAKNGKKYEDIGKIKSVLQCDLEDSIVAEWKSVTSAAQSTGYNRTLIGSACNNKSKGYADYPNKYKGYIWKFK